MKLRKQQRLKLKKQLLNNRQKSKGLKLRIKNWPSENRLGFKSKNLPVKKQSKLKKTD